MTLRGRRFTARFRRRALLRGSRLFGAFDHLLALLFQAFGHLPLLVGALLLRPLLHLTFLLQLQLLLLLLLLLLHDALALQVAITFQLLILLGALALQLLQLA